MALTRQALRCALVVSAFAAGCLPLGPAPAGRRLLADGTAYDVQFVPGPEGTPPNVVTIRLTSGFSIYSVHEPVGGAALGTETFLIDDVGTGANPQYTSSLRGWPTDTQGRMFVSRSQVTNVSGDAISLDTSVARVDPAQDEAIDFGPMSQLVGTFLNRTSFAYRTPQSLRIRDAADAETQFDHVSAASVVNDVLYFLTQDGSMGQGTLRRLAAPPFDVPETVATGVTYFAAYEAEAPVLIICRDLPGDTICRTTVFDPATGQETALPTELGGIWSISPSGRYLFAVRSPSNPTDVNDTHVDVSLFDRTLGVAQSATLGALSATYWRPGHDELWLVGTPLGADQLPDSPETGQSSLWRWTPGAPPAIVLAQQSAFYPPSSDVAQWPFTPDGRFLLTFPASSQTDKPPVALRAADDPATPLLLLNPTGTGVQDVRQLPDGRLVVSDWITDSLSADIYLIDPDVGTMRPLGQGGNVVATGATRVLARLDWIGGSGSGSLSLIDLVTGATTLLAENVHAVAVAPPLAGGDLLLPGERVAYVSRNRIASSYDGLWVTSLP